MSWFKRLFFPSTAAMAEAVVADTHVGVSAPAGADSMLELSRLMMEEQTSLMELRMQIAYEQAKTLALEVKTEAVCNVVAHLAAAHVRRDPQQPLTMEDVERLAAQAVMAQRLMDQDKTLAPPQALREASLEVRAKARYQRLSEILEVEQVPQAGVAERL